jgi:exosortase/archaeosortase family protein
MDQVPASLRPPRGSRARPSATKESLRFLLAFAASAALFEAVFMGVVDGSSAFHSYLSWTAGAAAGLLEAFGFQASRQGNTIEVGTERMEVLRGCDGLEVMGLFVIAVLLFPSAWSKKLTGALLGVAVLAVLNVCRVVTLTTAWVRGWSLLETLHTAVWPMIFVFAAVLLWCAWALRASTRTAVR